MTTNAANNLAALAALIGDPGRANMLAAMFDGRPLAASELAEIAGVTPQTASGHLAKLLEGKLTTVETRGRHRRYRLASGEVAQMLEAMMAVAARTEDLAKRATPRVPSYLREARTCYDHLAGRLGVALADRLVAMGAVHLTDEAGEITESGRALFAGFGIDASPGGSRRAVCRPCLDWSERRHHIGGALGRALLQRFGQMHWVEPGPQRRSLSITAAGRRGLKETFGLDC